MTATMEAPCATDCTRDCALCGRADTCHRFPADLRGTTCCPCGLPMYAWAGTVAVLRLTRLSIGFASGGAVLRGRCPVCHRFVEARIAGT